jgi:N-acetylmuramoyl-L-alanine amidase
MMARRRSSRTRHTPKKKKTALRTAKARGTAIARSVGFSIEDDRLVGAGVSFIETPNKGGDLAPRYLVFHYTAGKSATSSINWLTNPESMASAHLVLARDGTITQLERIKGVGSLCLIVKKKTKRLVGAQGRLSSGDSSAVSGSLNGMRNGVEIIFPEFHCLK